MLNISLHVHRMHHSRLVYKIICLVLVFFSKQVLAGEAISKLGGSAPLVKAGPCTPNVCALRETLALVLDSMSLDLCDREAVLRHFRGAAASTPTTEAGKDEARGVLPIGLTVNAVSSQREGRLWCGVEASLPDRRFDQKMADLVKVYRPNLEDEIQICLAGPVAPPMHGPMISSYFWCDSRLDRAWRVAFTFHDDYLFMLTIEWRR